MTKRPLLLVAVSFLLGIAFQDRKDLAIWALLAMACFVGMAAAARAKRIGARGGLVTAIFLLAAFALGAWRMGDQASARDQRMSGLQDGKPVSVQGVAIQKRAGKSVRYLFTHCYYRQNMGEAKQPVPCGQVLVYLDTDAISVGDTIVVDGTVKKWEGARNEGGFDEKSFYQSQGIDFCVYGNQIRLAKRGRHPLLSYFSKMKEKIKAVYQQELPEEEAGILGAMTLGEKDTPEEIKEIYQRAGIIHILAISGLHISLIGMGILNFLKRCGTPPILGMGLSAVAVCLFSIFVMPSASTKRAVGMFLLLLFSKLVGRSYDSLTAMACTALLLLWENPFFYAYSGFQLSYLAVLGANASNDFLKILKARDKEALVGAAKAKGAGDASTRGAGGTPPQKRRRRWEQCRASLVLTAAIQIFTIPIIASNYYEIPLYVIPINLVLLPTVGAVLFLGMAGGFLGGMGLGIAWLPLQGAGLLLKCYGMACRFCLSLPNCIWTIGKPDGAKVVCYYVLLGVALWASHGWSRPMERISRLGFAGLLGMLLLLPPKKTEFQVKVLDVGQGDGTYIASEKKTCYFVDGGSTDVSKVGRYRILPFLKSQGRSSVDCWFVSHCDADHINGLAEALESGYRIKRLVFADWVVRDDAFLSLHALAKKHGCKVSFLKAGESVTDGSVRFTACSTGQVGEDRNAASLVLLLETEGFRGLLTGDIGSEQEEHMEDIGEIDWYKAAHHGSGKSNSKVFLQKLSPQVATISYGVGNSYGHPAEEAMENIQESGARIYCTGTDGQITIRQGEEGLVVEGFP